MSDSDLMDTKPDICGGTSSSNGNSLLPRTPPNCARCKNHGLKITLKGHKRYCKYRCCNCEKCRLTSDRQKIMALQTSWRRAQAQDEARGLLIGEVPPIRSVSSFLQHHHLYQHNGHPDKITAEHSKDLSEPDPPIQPSLEGSCDSSSSPSSTSGVATSTLVRKITPIQSNGAHMPFGQSAEVFLEYCQKLLEKFRYPWEMMPLMYVILKDAKADIEEASRRIDEAKQLIKLIYPFRNLDYFTHALPFAPTTCLPFHPIYLGGSEFYYSQICSTTTNRPPITEPPTRPRSRFLPVAAKPKPENTKVESSST